VHSGPRPENGVAIDTSVLEVNSSCTICTDDNLELYFCLVQRRPFWCSRRQTLSYHLLVHVPTWSPSLRSYVPHKKLEHKAARSSPFVLSSLPCAPASLYAGAASSRHTTNRASSTRRRQAALVSSSASVCLKLDQVLLFSVVRTPIA